MLPDHRPNAPSPPPPLPISRRPGPGRLRRRLLPVGAGAALVLVASACGGGTSTGAGGQPAQVAAGAADTTSLRGVCPSTVVMQTNWFPQVEHASAYQLLGAGYTVNASKKTVTGPLIAHGGVDTGVKIEIRAGGPAIGNQQTSAQMYLDRSITLGMNATDETVQNAVHQPTVAVLAPFEIDPLVLIWDPKAHPEFNTISDIGQTNTPVLYFQGESTYMDYLIGSGILRRSQADGSYDGTPDYRDQWVIRADDRQRLAPCLHKLIPIMQQSLVDFMTDPKPTTGTILSILSKYHTFYTDSEARSAHAVQVMKDDGLVGNGSNKMIGDFDMDRVRTLIRIVTPIYTGQNKQVRAGLKAEDIATNDFIDPSIGLTRS